ncbi:hypothetical protein LTR08_004212 [Meristemomyces frigidus]|nr:hypothetical protein LTR08_004212 [Meristemomyces frigidus]
MATTTTNEGPDVWPDINRGLRGLATDWTLASISCIIVLLRLYAKGIIIRKLGWDDLLTSLALLTALGHAIAMTEAFHYGWGRHVMYLSDLDRTNATKWIFISQGLGGTRDQHCHHSGERTYAKPALPASSKAKTGCVQLRAERESVSGKSK